MKGTRNLRSIRYLVMMWTLNYKPGLFFGILSVSLLQLIGVSQSQAHDFEKENIHTTEVFIKHIKPSFFGWDNEGKQCL